MSAFSFFWVVDEALHDWGAVEAAAPATIVAI